MWKQTRVQTPLLLSHFLCDSDKLRNLWVSVSSAIVLTLHIRHFANKVTAVRIQKLLNLTPGPDFGQCQHPKEHSVQPPWMMAELWVLTVLSPHCWGWPVPFYSTIYRTETRARRSPGSRRPLYARKARLLDTHPGAQSSQHRACARQAQRNPAPRRLIFKNRLMSRSVCSKSHNFSLLPDQLLFSLEAPGTSPSLLVTSEELAVETIRVG